MTGINKVLHEQMRSLGKDKYKMFLCREVIKHWDELVDEEIAAQVKPVTIEHGVLFVQVSNSAFKDQLKFYSEEIIEAINENFGQEEPLVKEIRPAKGFQVANMPADKSEPAQVKQPKVTLETITLTDEEIKSCEEQAAKFTNEQTRTIVLNTFLSHMKSQKFKLANGWHKCKNCEVLCPPEELFCVTCKIKEREAMIKELYRIFYDAPQTKTHEAQELLLERMPYMREECLPEVVESARTSLIQKIASKVRIGDEDSSEVKRLVALEKRLPIKKLTSAIIKRTLLDMQFNLSDQSLLLRYNSRKSKRK